jgi:chromosome segregation protein
MNLKKLELFGFKSFMRKLDIHFSDGITVIVGPNGCGKTNVTDALRWVLGEGNARMLRGTRMEDLIFNGTRDFKPLNLAEVSLTIDNSTGVLPVEYSEVTVTRRVFREGEPEFLINRVPGRLRDIHELFMDTGLGSRAYSVIERGMIDMVLSDQPEKRRELLEEAAGIMKYKIRHRQAQRKLEATDEDLHRIQDVLREVERQVRSLKRQVGAARRFQEVRDRRRELEIALALVDHEQAGAEVTRLRRSLEENRTEREGAQGKVAAIEADLETHRVRMAEIDHRLADVQREVDGLAEETRRLEGENLVRRERRESLLETSRRLARERDELREHIRAGEVQRREIEERIGGEETRLGEAAERRRSAEESLVNVESDLEGRQERLQTARRAVEDAAREMARLETELSNFRAREEHLADRDAVLVEEARGIETSLATRREEQGEARRRLERARGEIARLEAEIEAAERGRAELDERREGAREQEKTLSVGIESVRATLDMLRNLEETREGYAEGPRRLLGRDEGRLAALADSLHPTRPDLIPALDAALEGAVQYLVAPDAESALDAVRFLKGSEGRATLVDLAAYREAAGRTETPAPPDDPAVLGTAASFLEVPGDLGPVLDDLMARTVLVETLEDALRLARRRDGRGLRFVARDGDWAEFPGLIRGGSSHGASESRILGRADQIAELETKVAADERAREEIRSLTGRIAGERDELAATLDRLGVERESERDRVSEEERTLERLAAEIAGAETRRERIETERAELGQQRGEIERARADREASRSETAERVSRLEEDAGARERELTASTEDRDRIRHDCHELRLEEQRLAGEIEKLRLERQRNDETRRADEEGIVRREEELAATDRTVGELARELEVGQAAFATKAAELEERKRGRDDVARHRSEEQQALRGIEEERSRWTKLRDQSAEAVHQQEMRLQRLESGREELSGRVRREFSVDLEADGARVKFGALLDADEEALTFSRRELEDLQKQMERMGAVNLVAIEQYERETKRLEFLTTQRDDLEEAREKLRRTIRKINRTARSMFMETLDRVRENFQKTFGTLFEGGYADIRLAGEEDPLHASVEIFARPRGKRLNSIALMSSGERALTAVAFLFAIYLVKPSPFCILDEVDAPLDDANIGRFLDMLKKVAEKTQFVMITHNKKTMEVADYLYGVTMEEPGVSKLVSVHLGKGGAPVLGDSEYAPEESVSIDDLVVEETA